MRTRQCLQRAPRTIHERIGMLSYHAIVLPHEGHCDLPERGREPHRATKTLRKLPTMRPKRPNPSPLRERTSINLADVKRQCHLQGFKVMVEFHPCVLHERNNAPRRILTRDAKDVDEISRAGLLVDRKYFVDRDIEKTVDSQCIHRFALLNRRKRKIGKLCLNNVLINVKKEKISIKTLFVCKRINPRPAL